MSSTSWEAELVNAVYALYGLPEPDPTRSLEDVAKELRYIAEVRRTEAKRGLDT